MFFSAIYNITIYPIEFIIESIFYLFYNKFQSSYVESLIFLSISVNLLSLPLYNIAEKWQDSEREIQNKMKPMIENIKAVYKGDQRYLLIRACQRIHGYKTIYAFRGTLGLLIQIPFFIAAYNFIYKVIDLSNVSFLFIDNLSKPDALLHFGNISINVFPFIMTLFSLIAGIIYSKKLSLKESYPLYIVSILFLVLLYNSPSALLIYWTFNCLFSLIKNIVIEYKLYNVFVINKYKLRKIYNIFFIFITIVVLILFSLGLIERRAYMGDFNFVIFQDNNYIYDFNLKYYSTVFRSSDIFKFKYTDKYLDNGNNVVKIFINDGVNTIKGRVYLNTKVENINENIDLYYRLYLKKYVFNIYLILLILAVLFNFNMLYSFILRKEDARLLFENNNLKLMIISSLLITILSGISIPSSLIGASPNEFSNPYYFIVSNFSISIGLFFFYPLFIYILSCKSIKNMISFASCILVFIALINTFVFVGDYYNINGDLIFENTDLLIASNKEVIYTIFSVLLVIFTFSFILIKKKISIIFSIYYIVIFTLLLTSIFNIYNIKKSFKIAESNIKRLSENEKIFNVSQTGTNVFVILLDRAMGSFWMDSFEYYPEYKTNLDGFTIYPNTVSLSQSTITAFSLYGGYDYLPYEMSTNFAWRLPDTYNETSLVVPLALEKYNYKSSVLSPVYTSFDRMENVEVYSNAIKNKNLSIYTDSYIEDFSIKNYSEDIYNELKKNGNRLFIVNKMIRFSIFKMLPINFRYDFYSKKDWFLMVNKNINSSIYTYALLDSTKDLINITNDGNYYNFIHNNITHEAYFFNHDFLPHFSTLRVPQEYLDKYDNDISVRHYYANIASINLIIRFINYLKNNQIYDNTKIIVISDHGVSGVGSRLSTNQNLDFMTGYNALLLVKDFDERGEIKINTNFMTISDMPYLSVKHIPNVKNVFNGNIITNDRKNNVLYLVDNDGLRGFLRNTNTVNFDIVYTVKDNIFDTNNWTRYKMDWKNKELIKIGLYEIIGK